MTICIATLYDSNFIQRMVYKDLYWLTILYFDLCIVLYFILLLSCWARKIYVLLTHNKRILYCTVLKLFLFVFGLFIGS